MMLAAPLVAAAITAQERPASRYRPVARTTPDPDPAALLDTARAEPDPTTAAGAAEAIRAFTADLYRDLAQVADSPGNLVCSPYSVATALAMTRAGARGTTAAEIDRVLHAPEPTPTALDAGLNTLDQLMIAQYRDHDDDGTKQPRLATANSLWPQDDLPVEAAFRETLAAYYGATTHPADYRLAAESARQEINAWVSEQTAGKIPELLVPGVLTPATLFVLVNALYLKASWQVPFDPDLTIPAGFYPDDGPATPVVMMTAPAQYLDYAETGDWFAVSLPYAGYQLAMSIVVPRTGSLATLEAALDGPWLARLLGGFDSTRIQLSLPRWETRVPAQLRASLSRLGMPTAFTSGADLSGISPVKPLFVDAVVHETYISVDEKGTEAAAATAVIGFGGISEPPPPPKPVIVDRPFLYVIHDVARAVPLFIGRVSVPTAA
ncbi:MAG: serpin family protein [Dactylosporangium sp.]|nr:serpin family protein [Dactylosporangium sp.]